MKKIAANYQPGLDVMCVDSTGGIDRDGYRLFAFVVPFVTGAVPVAFGICQDEKSDTLKKLFGFMKTCIGEYEPKCIMTDDSAAERDALCSIFNTSILLLCQFHVVAVIIN